MAITSQTSLDENSEKKVTLASFYAKNTKTMCNPLTEPYKFDVFDSNSPFNFPSILSDLGIKNDLIETMEKINQMERKDYEKKKKLLGVFFIILIPFIIFTSGNQSFTSLMADLHQVINRVSSFSRCLNGTFP